ncbi:MAG: hypothetical protein ABIM50_03625, partial [Novosphingobium sp.]
SHETRLCWPWPAGCAKIPAGKTGKPKGHMHDQPIEAPLAAAPPRRWGRSLLWGLVLFLLLACGLLVAAWQVPAMQRQIAALFGLQPAWQAEPTRSVASQALHPPTPAFADQSLQAPATALSETAAASSIGERLAELEKRLTRIDVQSQAASGNAARAEGLLIAFAARRTLDRGAPLGYLEDQLRLRFADAQPNAVETLITAAHSPVTLELLYAQLDALAPKLAGAPAGEDSWGRVKRELAGLFVIRQQSGASVRPEDRIATAKLLLTAGKTGEAVTEIERLPGAVTAQPWIAAARRYDAIQRALDLIETTAMLDPHRLNDSAGSSVNQPSPLAPPGV